MQFDIQLSIVFGIQIFHNNYRDDITLALTIYWMFVFNILSRRLLVLRGT